MTSYRSYTNKPSWFSQHARSTLVRDVKSTAKSVRNLSALIVLYQIHKQNMPSKNTLKIKKIRKIKSDTEEIQAKLIPKYQKKDVEIGNKISKTK